jgi:cytochrome c-type biogenesis protein
MEGFLTDLLERSSFPVVTAFLLGLLTAVSPCPLATNITAIGYISRNIENQNRVFINGLIYTSGKAISYISLAVLLYFGANQVKLAGFFQKYGERFLGPLLVILGLLMLGIFTINFPGFRRFTEKFQQNGITRSWDVLLLGVVFALAFCPYSGVLYFGMLIPMTISSASGILLPIVFALATSIPVIIFAWLIAYAVSGVGKLYNRLRIFEIWFRKIIAVLFVGVGIYYIVIIYFL